MVNIIPLFYQVCGFWVEGHAVITNSCRASFYVALVLWLEQCYVGHQIIL